MANLLVILLNRWLGRSRRQPPVSMQALPREQYTEARLRELHAFAERLMAEDFGHFCIHARTNDTVHVFRRTDTGEIAGFQFWRVAEMSLPRSRVILGGKLRIAPAFRNRGLHLLSGLVFFLQNKVRHPLTRHYRLSIASIFGFVSIAEALHTWQFLDMQATGREGRAVVEAFRQLARENHFVLDERSGNMFVNILMTPQTLNEYSAAYFDRPAAKAYAAMNPGFRNNGCFASFWFRFTPRNLRALVRQVIRKQR